MKKKTIDIIGDWLIEHKADNLINIDLTNENTFAEYLILVTATSSRHAQSLADGILELCKEKNIEYLSMEGYKQGQWILVDLNDIIVNIFLQSIRELYKLEEFWMHRSQKDK